MKPAISIITVGVDDLERAFAFYRGLLELPDEQIGAGEDHVAFFFSDAFSLVLFPRAEIAAIAGRQAEMPGSPGFVLTHRAGSPPRSTRSSIASWRSAAPW